MSVKKYWIALGFLALGAGLLYWFNPAEAKFFPKCPLHALTGLYCPGCGSTRAAHHLLHGDLAGAFAMNPLMVASAPVLVLLFFRRSWAMRPWVAWTAFAALIVYCVLRNISAWPFILLAPK
jgi:hypothetical protein